MRPAHVLLLALPLFLGQAQPVPGDSTAEIIERLRNNPAELGLIGELEKRSSDPRVVPALKELFIQAKRSRVTGFRGYPVAQEIASVLLALGQKDDIYFDEIAGAARDAIEADPPASLLSDTQGNETAQKRNPAFEVWCAARALEWDQCTFRMAAYVRAIGALSATKDRRSIDILRKALRASSYVIVLSAANGLAILNDTDSIPLIAQACARLPQLEAERIVAFLTNFEDPSVEGLLFDRFIKDGGLRERVTKEWRQKHKKDQ